MQSKVRATKVTTRSAWEAPSACIYENRRKHIKFLIMILQTSDNNQFSYFYVLKTFFTFSWIQFYIRSTLPWRCLSDYILESIIDTYVKFLTHFWGSADRNLGQGHTWYAGLKLYKLAPPLFNVDGMHKKLWKYHNYIMKIAPYVLYSFILMFSNINFHTYSKIVQIYNLTYRNIRVCMVQLTKKTSVSSTEVMDQIRERVC